MYWQNPMYPGQQPPMPPPASQQQQQQQQQQRQPPPPPQQQQQQNQHQMASTTSLPAQSPAPSRQSPTPVLNGSVQEQSSVVQSTPTAEQVDQQEIDGAAVENLAKQVSELDVDTKEGNEVLVSSQRQNNYRSGRQNSSNYFRQNNSSTSTTNGARNQQNDRHQRTSIPQSDFDFESSNAKFRKNDLLKELKKDGDDDDKRVDNNEKQPHHQPQVEEEVIIPPNDEDFYNKSKSFFDNISCESKERQDQQDGGVDRRGKFQEERRLNLETFGQASVDQSRFRNFRGRGGYRGGYRGNRGGGYYRGGNRNNSYNNNNNNRNNAYGHRPQQQAEYQQQ
ncbi:unnamed protein product [Absidia cylindrospora]